MDTNANTGASAHNVYQKGGRAPVTIKPTYPLDADQIRRLRETAMLDSPKFLVWQLLAQLGSRFTLLSRFSSSWAEVEPRLSDAVVEHVIKQSNAAQDYVVHSLTQVLRDNGCDEYADTLTKFLHTKQAIELALRTNARLAPQRADVETIVDAIVQEVCNEIFLVTELHDELLTLEGKHGIRELAETMSSVDTSDEDYWDQHVKELRNRVATSLQRIDDAYETLKETEKQTTFQQPTQSRKTESALSESMVLDRLIESLREENDVAKTVNDRMCDELPAVE